MKKLIFLLFLIPVFASAQKTTGTNYTYIAQRYEWLAGVFKALGLPAGDSPAFQTGQEQRAGAVYYDSTGGDAGLYIWDGIAWVLQGGISSIPGIDDVLAIGQKLSVNRKISGTGNGFTMDSLNSISLFSGLEYVSTGIGSFIQMSDSVTNMGSSSVSAFASITFTPTSIKFTPSTGVGVVTDVWTNLGNGKGHWAAPTGGGGDAYLANNQTFTGENTFSNVVNKLTGLPTTDTTEHYVAIQADGTLVKAAKVTLEGDFGIMVVSDSAFAIDTLDVDYIDWLERTLEPNLLFDSLGAAGISPVTTWNDSLYARRISISGGSIDTTASGGLLITVTAAGANTALSNLASVAVNTSLISDADNTDDLGSPALAWKDAYVYTFKIKNSGGGTTTLQGASSASNFTQTLPAATTTLAGLSVAQTFTANQIFSGGFLSPRSGFYTNTTSTTSNLGVPSAGDASQILTSQFLFRGATSVYGRVLFRGSTSTGIGANSSYGGLIIGDQGVNETAGASTHDLMAALVVKGSNITNNATAITNHLATVYIEGLMTGVTPVTGNYSLWVDDGAARLDGGIVGTATNDAATAGNVGQEINAVVSTYTNYATTATYQNVTSIALTAGDWDISAFLTYSANGATLTAASDAIYVISTTTASAAGATEGIDIGYIAQAALLGTSKFSDAIPPHRVSIASTTTYYLNTQATFTLGNPQYVGSIRARRIR